ncbi:MAG: hypothetical protein CSA13_01205 [Clostridiales bacterium]|nr:MAG: hypothetical protein CSA13_01205 [Clostridiales bacterium]
MVVKTSLFPAAKSEVFERLQGFAILSEIAYPYITFKPLDGNEDLQWEVGQSFSFKAKLLGFIPFSIHKINVLEFDEKTRIYTHEQNTYVPVWNHEIVLREMGERETEYTDRVEIYAGWKTIFIYIWANMFYAHRQRKWISILKKSIK